MSGEVLRGRTALVTGAAKRVGREIALALARAGVHVIVHFRKSAKEAEELRVELASHGVRAWLVEADFNDIAATQRLIPEIFETAGSLDILVNSASLFLPSTLQDMDFAGLMQHMQVNA
jgi:NAD(P)-dependent dehydrogenase (short-subunit alcohol dehydrogenase family)